MLSKSQTFGGGDPCTGRRRDVRHPASVTPGEGVRHPPAGLHSTALGSAGDRETFPLQSANDAVGR